MVTEYLLSKIERQIERSRTSNILFDKAEIQELVSEIKRQRLKERMSGKERLQ